MVSTKIGATALFAIASIAAANADIVILVGPGGVDGDENILFNEPGLIDQGLTIEGITNNTSRIVDFVGQEELVSPSGGQARVEATDGGYTDLYVELPDEPDTYTSLVFNINSSADGTVDVTIDSDNTPQVLGSFDISEGGQNFFRVIASDASVINRVTMHTSVDMMDVRQIRIGGIVPEPASFVALGCGVAMLAALRRRR
jgi:hypothetical protein